jgi:hypothetical protein
MRSTVDEMVGVAMFTLGEQARKGCGAAEMCLLRRVLLRILETAAPTNTDQPSPAAPPPPASAARTPKKGAPATTPKGRAAAKRAADAEVDEDEDDEDDEVEEEEDVLLRSPPRPKGRPAKRSSAAAAAAASTPAHAEAAAAQEAAAAAAAAASVVGAEDETMDAGGGARVVTLSVSERRVVEARCRALCGLLVQRIVRLRPKRASSDSDEADDRPTQAAVLAERLEALLGATAALLSFVQTLPQLVWSIQNVTRLMDREAVDAQALEELVGCPTRMSGLRMRILIQSALLADAVIATAPPKMLVQEASCTLQRHLAASANRVRHQGALNALIKCLCTLSSTGLATGGVPYVAFMSFCKYVEFVTHFTKHRSQRRSLLPFIPSALLGTGALCRYLDWKAALSALTLTQAPDRSAAEKLARFEKLHKEMVSICVGVLADDADERVRRCAMQCLGGMLVHTPTLLLQEDTSKLVRRALSPHADASSQVF